MPDAMRKFKANLVGATRFGFTALCQEWSEKIAAKSIEWAGKGPCPACTSFCFLNCKHATPQDRPPKTESSQPKR